MRVNAPLSFDFSALRGNGCSKIDAVVGTPTRTAAPGQRLSRLNEDTGKRDQAIGNKPMSRSNRFAIALVAVAVCGYFARVHISCALDPHCHLQWCHKQACGISYDKQNEGTP